MDDISIQPDSSISIQGESSALKGEMMIQLVLCNAEKFHQNVNMFLDLSSALAFRISAALLEAKNERICCKQRQDSQHTKV
jgi:hypothetical protein